MNNEIERERDANKKEIAKLTDMLCRMINLSLLSDEPITLNEIDKDIQEWWIKHNEKNPSMD